MMMMKNQNPYLLVKMLHFNLFCSCEVLMFWWGEPLVGFYKLTW